MRNMQTFFKENILPAQTATDNAIYHRALSTAAAQLITVPTGARYVVFTKSSSLSNSFAAEFGTSLTATTTSAFPSANSTAATGIAINPTTRYLSPDITTIALSTPDVAAKVCAEFFA